MLCWVSRARRMFAVSQLYPLPATVSFVPQRRFQIRQSPAIPNMIKLKIDLSRVCAGISAAAAAVEGALFEASWTSAIELLATGAIVPLTARSWGYELVATFLLLTRTGT